MLEEDLKKVRAGMAFLLLELPMRVDEKVFRYYVIRERKAIDRLLATYGLMAQAVNLSKQVDAELEMMEEQQQEQPQEVKFNLDDWIKKECYFIYTTEEKEAIEAFENLLAIVARVPMAERIEDTIPDDDENAQEEPINFIRFDVMAFEAIRHEQMITGPEEDLLWPTDNGSEEEDEVMEEPTMQELPSVVREQRNPMMEKLLSVVREQPDSMMDEPPSVVREQPDSTMDERPMWEDSSLMMGEQSWWLRQQRWWLLQKQMLQDPDWMMEERLMWEYQSLMMGEQSWYCWWLKQKQILQDPDSMMEGTDRMADGNSTEGDDAMEDGDAMENGDAMEGDDAVRSWCRFYDHNGWTDAAPNS